MSKLINRESLKRSLLKTKSYIDNKLETIRGVIQTILDNTPDESLSLESSNAVSNKTVTEEINKINTTIETNNTSITERLNVIQGEDEGSIKKEVSKGIASIVDSAPDTLDTLKEVADWIKQDETNSAQIIEDLNNIPITTGEGDKSIVLKGTENYTAAPYSIAVGERNTVGDVFSIAVGHTNYVGGQDSVTVGRYNYINPDTNSSLTCGTGIKTLNSNEAAFGKYNDFKENLLFSIGCGADDNNRRNAIEVRDSGAIYIEGSPTIPLNEHVSCRSAYFPELESYIGISLCTPVIFYYTKEGLSSVQDKMTPIEIWRLSIILRMYNSPIFVKCYSFEDDDKVFHMASFSVASLCFTIDGVYLTWESLDYKYKYDCGTQQITYTPKNPPEKEYLHSPILLGFNRVIPTTLYDSDRDNFKLFDIQNNRVYPYAIYEGKQLIRSNNSVGVYLNTGDIAKVTVHNGIVGDLSDSY